MLHQVSLKELHCLHSKVYLIALVSRSYKMYVLIHFAKLHVWTLVKRVSVMTSLLIVTPRESSPSNSTRNVCLSGTYNSSPCTSWWESSISLARQKDSWTYFLSPVHAQVSITASYGANVDTMLLLIVILVQRFRACSGSEARRVKNDNVQAQIIVV